MPTFEVELDHVEEALLKKLPFKVKMQIRRDVGCLFEKKIGKDECKSGRWLQVSESVYGFCVSYFVQDGVPTDIAGAFAVFFFTFTPCLVIGFVQGYLIYKLVDGTPKLEDTDFCAHENTRFLFTCIIGVF